MTHHSLSGKIAVLHVVLSALFGELHLQRRVLEDVRVKLDDMYEVNGATLKKQTDITEVLDVLPENVRRAFSGDMQRLHQQLQRCGSRAKDYVKRLVDNSVSRIVRAYEEHQALQRRHQKETKRYLSQLLQQQRQIQHVQHKELKEQGSVVLGAMNHRFDQIERMISMLQTNRNGYVLRTDCLLYDHQFAVNLITDLGIGHLGPLPQLTLLSLSECSKITDAALRGLGPMPHLTTLGLYQCSSVTDLGIGHLGPLPQLTRLDLGDCRKVTDAALTGLGPMPHL
ncbi:receptor-type protein kinase, putative [Bodo saltans]|uniref:Receptor-type protein kinase, putative n=1 Tax=Bodo saltans TaxID=75058 RepID=A0A0S4JL18_BODSA|nr:receptor-type protein kinase, putative [Bodo saltans]|eukprot:CUG89717.1 receptor-type protein kinase, putative [Bodo saltans]